jgi:hypothetical protein
MNSGLSSPIVGSHGRGQDDKTPAGSVQSAVAPPALIHFRPIYAANGPWSAAMDARLVAMWRDGMSTVDIGLALGVSKNSVISRKRRLPELDARPSPIKTGGRVKPKRKPPPIALDLPSRPAVTPPSRGNDLRWQRAIMSSRAPRDTMFDDPIKLATFGVAREGSGTQQPRFIPSRATPLPIPRGAIGPARTCQWTDCKRAPWLFCDGPTVPNKSWCETHSAIVFRPAE